MQAILQSVIQFLKKHYEKIILCAVLLGLAAAAIWMGSVITQLKAEVSQSPISGKGKAVPALDLTADMQALAQVTNPPPVVLFGDHNLFNPVTWKKKASGELLKILRSGPDALAIVNLTPLYTVIAYDHPTGSPNIYVFTVQTNSGRKATEHPKLDEKTRSGLYIIRGIKGAADNPDELQLEIPATQETVWITHNNPYKRVDGYIADLKYDPESHNLPHERVNEIITLDSEQYKIVEITNNAVRVQSIKNTKVTTIKWNRTAESGASSTAPPK